MKSFIVIRKFLMRIPFFFEIHQITSLGYVETCVTVNKIFKIDYLTFVTLCTASKNIANTRANKNKGYRWNGRTDLEVLYCKREWMGN